MNAAWLLLIVPAVALLFLGLGLVLGAWNRPDDRPDTYGSPEDPFQRDFLE